MIKVIDKCLRFPHGLEKHLCFLSTFLRNETATTVLLPGLVFTSDAVTHPMNKHDFNLSD